MRLQALLASVILTGALTVIGCHKKVAVAPPTKTEAQQPVAATTPPQQQSAPEVATAPAPVTHSRYPDAATRAKIDELLARIQDAYFDYDKHDIRPDAEKALRDDAQTLATIIRQYPDFKLVVQGNCDERGSDEYNLALGQARAQQAKEYLVTLGLPAAQMDTISYGKDKPVCTEHNETCWQKNRRAHLAAADTVGGA
jgi:peptidoglycan-associated lipoprotein